MVTFFQKIRNSFQGFEKSFREERANRRILENLDQVLSYIDNDLNQSIDLEEFVRIPIVRSALASGWNNLLIPDELATKRRY